MSDTTARNVQGFWSRVIAFAESHPRMSELCTLANLSDEDLAARGKTRRREMQRILGVRFYY